MDQFTPKSMHQGWHSRGYVPHFDRPNLIQAITFRLHDSMPQVLLDQWRHELLALPEVQSDAQRQRRIAAYLDAGHGACWLRDSRLAEMVENAFLHFVGARYRLLAWAVMPNHVHLLIEHIEGWPLAKLVQSWKTWTAKRANKILCRAGTFWGRDYFDRYIRDGEHFAFARRYIHENPVKAKLCASAERWRWSSAFAGRWADARGSL